MRQSHRILLLLLVAIGSAMVLSALVPSHARAADATSVMSTFVIETLVSLRTVSV